MDGITELAVLLKERDNPSIQGICIGKVVSDNPLKVTVNTLLLEKERLIISERLTKTHITTYASVGDHGSHNHSWSNTLKKGDRVIIISSIDNSKYYVIDKVGEA